MKYSNAKILTDDELSQVIGGASQQDSSQATPAATSSGTASGAKAGTVGGIAALLFPWLLTSTADPLTSIAVGRNKK
jgi:bacteriocin-like protein